MSTTGKPTAEQMLTAVWWMLEADIVPNADGDVRAVAQWLIEQARTEHARGLVADKARAAKAEGKRLALSRAEAVRYVADRLPVTLGHGLTDDMARDAGLRLGAAVSA